MNAHASTTERPDTAASVMSAVAVMVLATVGYLGAANLSIIIALVGVLFMIGWIAVTLEHPRLAVAASFVGVLVANTKFRTREADASLAGAIDAQIMLEIGLYAVMGLALLAIFTTGRTDRRRITGAEGIVIGYVGIAALSTIWSLAPVLTMVRSAQLGVIALLALITARTFTPTDGLRRIFTCVAGFVLVCAALALVFPFAAGTFVDGEHDGFRFAWFAAHPIEVGTFAAIGALGLIATIMFGSTAQPHRPAGISTFLASVLLIAVLAASAARGPILAFGIGLFTLFLMKLELRTRAALMAVAVAMVGALFVAGPDVQAWLDSASAGDSRLTYTFFRGQSAQDVLELNGRLALWSELRPAIVDRLFIGHGYLASRSIILDTAEWAAAAHNALLQSVLDLGIIGSLTLVALFGAALLAAARARTQWARAVLTSLIVFLAINSISTESFAGTPGFEMFLVFLCAISAGWDAADTSVESGWA
jgi:exopolysaccharide production protein ExoQ